MRIIKQGSPPNDPIVRFNCDHCSTVFECDIDEKCVKYVDNSYDHSARTDEYSCVCPTCKFTVWGFKR
jgi:hypothetical protein